MKIRRIDRVRVCGTHSLRLQFNNGRKKQVNLLPILRGKIFKPLLDPKYFGRVLLDPVAGTVVWPNGADFAPEALYELPAERDSPRKSAKKKSPRRTTRKASRR